MFVWFAALSPTMSKAARDSPGKGESNVRGGRVKSQPLWEPGLSTGIAYQTPIQDVLGPIAEAGFRVLEISASKAHLDVTDPKRLESVVKRIEGLGMRVHSMHAPFGPDIDFTSPDPDLRRNSLEAVQKCADGLQALGGKYYVIHPGGDDDHWSRERELRLARAVDGLERVWRWCSDRGLELVVETPLPHLLGGRPEDFDRILDGIPVDGTGVCLDTSHTHLAGTLLETPKRYSDRLVHVQASDNRGRYDDHLPPGEGKIPWADFVETLKRTGYRGVFMLEVSGSGNVQRDVRRAAEAVLRVLPDATS
jgi:sugar phosphate isomerase/epimerase